MKSHAQRLRGVGEALAQHAAIHSQARKRHDATLDAMREAGSRGVDRVPSHLRDLEPTVSQVKLPEQDPRGNRQQRRRRGLK